MLNLFGLNRDNTTTTASPEQDSGWSSWLNPMNGLSAVNDYLIQPVCNLGYSVGSTIGSIAQDYVIPTLSFGIQNFNHIQYVARIAYFGFKRDTLAIKPADFLGNLRQERKLLAPAADTESGASAQKAKKPTIPHMEALQNFVYNMYFVAEAFIEDEHELELIRQLHLKKITIADLVDELAVPSSAQAVASSAQPSKLATLLMLYYRHNEDVYQHYLNNGHIDFISTITFAGLAVQNATSPYTAPMISTGRKMVQAFRYSRDGKSQLAREALYNGIYNPGLYTTPVLALALFALGGPMSTLALVNIGMFGVTQFFAHAGIKNDAINVKKWVLSARQKALYQYYEALGTGDVKQLKKAEKQLRRKYDVDPDNLMLLAEMENNSFPQVKSMLEELLKQGYLKFRMYAERSGVRTDAANNPYLTKMESLKVEPSKQDIIEELKETNPNLHSVYLLLTRSFAVDMRAGDETYDLLAQAREKHPALYDLILSNSRDCVDDELNLHLMLTHYETAENEAIVAKLVSLKSFEGKYPNLYSECCARVARLVREHAPEQGVDDAVASSANDSTSGKARKDKPRII